jgi:UDP-glucose 4-epimerase
MALCHQGRCKADSGGTRLAAGTDAEDRVKVLVTGGAGFIGSHIAERLLSRGADVRVLDNFSTGRRENLAGFAADIDVVEGDIRSYERVHNAVRGCDAVFHEAALPSVPRSIADPLTSHATNATGTLNVLLASRDEGVRRVILASSSSVYGAATGLPKREDMPTLPISPYGVAKLAAEQYGRSFYEVYGLETVALRYFNVFGPRQDPASEYAAVIPKFIAALREGRAPVIFGDGEQSRDFTYVDNVVDGNLAALDAPGIGGRVYNIACGERITLNRLAAELRELLGAEAQAEHGPPRPGDIRHSLADVGRAMTDLGYAPAVDFEAGLRGTVACFGTTTTERPA